MAIAPSKLRSQPKRGGQKVTRPVKKTEAEKRLAQSVDAKKKSRRKKKVPAKDLAVVLRQMATMLQSGLTLVRALGVLAMQTRNETLTAVLVKVRDDVEHGRSLSDSMGRHPKTFGRLIIAMVRAGETGGVLDQTLGRLADTFEKEADLRRKVKSAMTYPAVIGSLSVIIVIAMLIVVVPTFEGLYADLGGTLPLPTQILLLMSRGVRSYFFIWTTATGLGFYAFLRWRATENGRYAIDKTLLKLPIFGRLFLQTALARFSRTFASMLRAGVPVLQALEITRETAGNAVIAEAIQKVSVSVRDGSSIAKPLEEAGVFPPLLTQMIAVGEETGSVDDLCEKVAEHFESEVDAAVAAMTSLVEPVLIAFLGIVIGGMVTALYLPMFKLVEIVG
jgi:type IV pilus assembly protein PilC